jgi:hypothetical protein
MMGFSTLHGVSSDGRPFSLSGEAKTREETDDNPSKTLRSGAMMGRKEPYRC